MPKDKGMHLPHDPVQITLPPVRPWAPLSSSVQLLHYLGIVNDAKSTQL